MDLKIVQQYFIFQYTDAIYSQILVNNIKNKIKSNNNNNETYHVRIRKLQIQPVLVLVKTRYISRGTSKQ